MSKKVSENDRERHANDNIRRKTVRQNQILLARDESNFIA
jgi:hypothetical protein